MEVALSRKSKLDQKRNERESVKGVKRKAEIRWGCGGGPGPLTTTWVESDKVKTLRVYLRYL